MKKSALLLLLGAVCLVAAFAFFAETLIVKIQTTQVRKDPKFYGQTLATLKVGDRVEKISAQNGWVQVRTASGISGWIHSSAVEPRKSGLLAMDKNLKTQASASEVALAGKGFNKQVESNYRARHGDTSFAWVDKMLQIKIPPSQVEQFLKQGKLGEFGGSK